MALRIQDAGQPDLVRQCPRVPARCLAFIAAIERGTAPETVGSDNIKSLAMVFAAIESAKAGQRIPIFT